VLLEDQDRTRWDRVQIDAGLEMAEASLRTAAPGAYAVQAAIAAEHARARRAEETNWRAIAQWYTQLVRLRPSPVVELNQAVAVAMADGPAAGQSLIDALKARGDLDGYYLLWSAEADLLRRLGRFTDAAASYRRALALVTTEPERRFLVRRLAEVEGR